MALRVESIGPVTVVSRKPTKFTPSPTLRIGNAFDIIRIASPALVDPQGKLDPANAASQFFDTVEITTSLTPPFAFNVKDFADSEPSMVNRFLKPTVRLKGPAGEFVISPYGEAKGIGWKLPAALVAGLAVLVTLKGRRRFKRDRARRG